MLKDVLFWLLVIDAARRATLAICILMDWDDLTLADIFRRDKS